MVYRSFVFMIISIILKCGHSSQSLYDDDLYESFLNNVTCERHLKEMDTFQFFDASGRIPQSITLGSLRSLGNYRQCLSLAQQLSNETIHGKYCMIQVPLQQNGLNTAAETNPEIEHFFELINMGVNETEPEDGIFLKKTIGLITGRGSKRGLSVSQSSLSVEVAVCLPRSCTTRQAIGQYAEMVNATYTDLYCRLPGDKVLSAADYVAMVVIGILGTLTALSTMYDLYYTFVLEKAAEKLLSSFSIYTNTRRLLTFHKTTGSIDCLDGIRSLSILWVVIGHTIYNNIASGITVNLLTALQWANSANALLLVSAVLSVDTFFMMSGLLIVYTTVNKMTPMSLVKNIHMFYLHRLLRMFPLLAVVVLFQASLFHHSEDGPRWPALAYTVTNCREWWWSVLLHVQNYVNSNEICLSHTWYLSVDMQLHVLSPLVLFWVLYRGRTAWLGVSGGLLVSLIITTTYCYVEDLPNVSLLGYLMGEDVSKLGDYFKYYYKNTLTRSPPFFVGMAVGYLLHIVRESPKRIPMWTIAAGWAAAFVLGSGMIYCNYSGATINRFWTNFLNSYMRALWALAVGWVVFACAQGYGGPVNWFLSLTVWKFLARISYALYLTHFPMQAIVRGQSETMTMFSVSSIFYVFYTDLALSVMTATALCVLVDAPFSTLQKIVFQGKTKPPPPPSNGLTSSSVEVLVK